MNNFEVIEFRFLTSDENYDIKYEAWSRIYEYPYVLQTLKKLGATENSIIHNSSWGFEGCHITFLNDLNNLYSKSLHSDIKYSKLNNTFIYDITQKVDEKYINYFDFVINVSTIEEVNYPNNIVINNLFEQVKPGGYLIVTFDYDKNNCTSFGNGSMNLSCIETLINKKIQPCEGNKINGINSFLPNSDCHHLNCGVLVIQKKY